MQNQEGHNGAIAIVGMACQFPGARDPADFHDLTVDGRRMFRPVTGPSRQMVPYAALLDGWTAIPGDPGPLRKLVAETIALALADAGLRSTDIHATGTRAGLVIASSLPDAGVGPGFGAAAHLDAVPRSSEAAQRYSLHAVSAACDALRTEDLDIAIAGGAELGIEPGWLAEQAAAGMLGTDEMRVYDANPAGLLPGDGCGIVVLMRSAAARAAGMPVYAEIAGWTDAAASPDGTLSALLRAYGQAWIDPADLRLVEGHGAGTRLADEAELTTLTQLRHGAKTSAALGAASASIGNTRAAMGVASLIKTVAAMVAGTIPPGTGCPRPHPLLESGDGSLRLLTGPEPWPDGPRLAAVNSLGNADPAHLILHREAEKGGGGRRRRQTQTAGPITGIAAGPVAGPAADPVLPPEPERSAPGRHAAHPTPAPPAAAVGSPGGAAGPPDNTAGPPGNTAGSPGGVPLSGAAPGPGQACATLMVAAPWPPSGRIRARPRQGRPTVFALCGTEGSDLAATLDVVAASAAEPSGTDVRDLARNMAATAHQTAERGAPLRVALTAAGPGELAVRARRASQLLRQRLAAPLVAEPGVTVSAGAGGGVVLVFPGLAGSPLEHTALLSASLDGLRVLDRLGVKARSALGYSFGEITGLVWAGCLPVAEAARLAVLRGQVLYGCAARSGAMARVTGDLTLIRRLCTPEGLHVAGYETPTSQLLAGPSEGVRNLAQRGAEIGTAVQILTIAGALHSPAMNRCAAPLRGVFAGTPFAAPRRRLISTVTGRLVTAADDIPGLLADQLTRPVLFAQAMAEAALGADLLVIAGPDADPASPHAPPAAPTPQSPPSLSALATAASGLPAVVARADVPQTLATLFTAGAITDLTPFLPVSWAVPAARDGENPDGHTATSTQTASSQNGTRRIATLLTSSGLVPGAAPSRAAAACPPCRLCAA